MFFSYQKMKTNQQKYLKKTNIIECFIDEIVVVDKGTDKINAYMIFDQYKF
jgi:hypothetical protein